MADVTKLLKIRRDISKILREGNTLLEIHERIDFSHWSRGSSWGIELNSCGRSLVLASVRIPSGDRNHANYFNKENLI